MKVVIIEPYYGGSHKSFLDILTKHLPYDFSLYTLPARKWKWRMRMAAPFFAGQFRDKPNQLADVSAIFCSPFLDVASFRGLLPHAFSDIPLYTYFHENQFSYPVQVDDERDFHFALTNLTTALASDKLAFNSKYNLGSLLEGAAKLLKINYDMLLPDYAGAITAKSTILYPPLNFSEIDAVDLQKKEAGAPVIIWNHRWEHDKNPELFFDTLFALDEKGLEFKLIVVGQSFRRVPEIFLQAQKRLANKTIHFGYVESREEYLSLLHKGDIVVSTANHEFYGISIIEAVRAGCRPLLPARLSYPELFPRDFLYEEGQFMKSLIKLLNDLDFNRSRGHELTEKFSWKSQQVHYQNWFTAKSFFRETHSP